MDNILIDQKGHIKICDFGISKIIETGSTIYEQVGTPCYIAPEILGLNGYRDFASDIWSAGVVLYCMLYG